MPKLIEASWYDFPRYYDLSFRSETQREADFIEAACRKYCPFSAKRLLEPGCGSGRLIEEMVRRGYEVIGFDENQRALQFLRERLKKFRAWKVAWARLESFSLKGPVDAAFCTMNTFRHLLSEAAARSHLHCVAKCLQPGGIYILGFHLLPLDVSEEDCERWFESEGDTRVTVTLRVLSTDRRKRIEVLRVSMRVRTPDEDLRIRSQFPLRMYTRTQFQRLLRSVPEFELCDVYDFWYEIDEPLELNEERTDAVFVLRKL
jgi:SAM-dependent methyltransferase